MQEAERTQIGSAKSRPGSPLRAAYLRKRFGKAMRYWKSLRCALWMWQFLLRYFRYESSWVRLKIIIKRRPQPHSVANPCRDHIMESNAQFSEIASLGLWNLKQKFFIAKHAKFNDRSERLEIIFTRREREAAQITRISVERTISAIFRLQCSAFPFTIRLI